MLLAELLGYYGETWGAGRPGHATYNAAEEQAILRRFQALVAQDGDIFARDHFGPGHITGSAMVVSPRLDRVVLTLHGKLNLWLQLGGHADGHPVPHDAAMREAVEESGLSGLRFLPYEDKVLTAPRTGKLAGVPIPFDFDVHAIPARKTDPEHFHYDVRYVIVADPARAELAISDESHDLRWFDLDEARAVTSERSMHRQFDKLVALQRFFRD